MDGSIIADYKLDHDAQLVSVFQQRARIGRKLLRQHGKILDARINSCRFFPRVRINGRALWNEGIHVPIPTKIFVSPFGNRAATSIWSRSREVSLSIEDQSRLRRSRKFAPGTTCGG